MEARPRSEKVIGAGWVVGKDAPDISGKEEIENCISPLRSYVFRENNVFRFQESQFIKKRRGNCSSNFIVLWDLLNNKCSWNHT